MGLTTFRLMPRGSYFQKKIYPKERNYRGSQKVQGISSIFDLAKEFWEAYDLGFAALRNYLKKKIYPKEKLRWVWKIMGDRR